MKLHKLLNKNKELTGSVCVSNKKLETAIRVSRVEAQKLIDSGDGWWFAPKKMWRKFNKG